MDIQALRDALDQLLYRLSQSENHRALHLACQRVGLPRPPEEEFGSKRDRVMASFSALPQEELPGVAERLLERHADGAAERNAVQDLLWADWSGASVPERHRREIARAIDAASLELYLDQRRFDAMLDSLWVLDGMRGFDFFTLSGSSLRTEIAQHVHRNPGDWTTEELFDRLGALDCGDRRFALFLEGLVSSHSRPDAASQRRFTAALTEPLQACGAELREVGEERGYPQFELVSLRDGVAAPVMNLIFASERKPDIRLRDAVSNELELVTGADEVLVYDRTIPAAGLTWSDLQAWWAEREQLENAEEAKASLYRRLARCLPTSSPPQRLLFRSYFSAFGSAIPHLPALLPEVWVHWDAKTVRQRGADALTRFRMDFLLLLPAGGRVVVEVDGRQHYADPDGRARPELYATMMAADRDLKLTGYEVYRFGAAELRGVGAEERAGGFFKDLLRRHGVKPAP